MNYIFVIGALLWLGSWVMSAYYWSKTEYFKSYCLDVKFISLFFCAYMPIWSAMYRLKLMEINSGGVSQSGRESTSSLSASGRVGGSNPPTVKNMEDIEDDG